MTPKQEAWAIQAEHVIKQMERRHFNAYYCSTKEEALTKALSIIEKGSVIASGGSATLGEVGLLDYIRTILKITPLLTAVLQKQKMKKDRFTQRQFCLIIIL